MLPTMAAVSGGLAEAGHSSLGAPHSGLEKHRRRQGASPLVCLPWSRGPLIGATRQPVSDAPYSNGASPGLHLAPRGAISSFLREGQVFVASRHNSEPGVTP